MKSYIIKVYPHKYMDRANGDHFKADTIACEVSDVIETLLKTWYGTKYQNNCTNEGYEYEIHNPEYFGTRNTRKRIELIFPEVSFIDIWIEREVNGIESNFKEDELNEDFNAQSDYYEQEENQIW